MTTKTKVRLTAAAVIWGIGVLALVAGCWIPAVVLFANATLTLSV